MTSTVFLLLPADPASAGRSAAWWRIDDDQMVDSGEDDGWSAFVDARLVGIAPAEATRLSPLPPDAVGNPQLTGKALIEARVAALGEATAVACPRGILVTDAGNVAAWDGWATRHARPLDAIVPLAALLPATYAWHRFTLPGGAVLSHGTRILPDEPALAAHLVAGEDVTDWEEGRFADWLVAATRALPVDLLGKRRRRWSLERDRLKPLGILALVLLVALLAMPLVELVRWNAAASSLDKDSVALASRALGRDVGIDEAEGALRAERVAPQAAAGAMLAALTEAMQAEPNITARSIDYTRGRLSVALSAPDPAALQRLANLLQRRGWRLAVQQTGSPSGNEIMLDMEAL